MTTTKLHSDSENDQASAQAKESQGLSTYLPQTAEALKQAGVTAIRAEYEKQELRIVCFADRQPKLSPKAVAMICIEIDQQLTLILRRRYPSHYEGDGSTGFFEWDLRTDVVRHEHTRIHYGV
jgi:hypothetical protein